MNFVGKKSVTIAAIMGVVAVLALAGFANATATITPNMPATFTIGEETMFNVTVTSDTTYDLVRYNITVSAPQALAAGDISLLYNASGTWLSAPQNSDGTDWYSWFGAGFNMTAGWDATTDFKATIADGAPVGTYDFTIDLVYTSDWTVIASVTDSFTVDAPVTNVDKGTGHTTIQDAVDAASAGDTIEVDTGTYDEVVVIDKADLTVQAASTPLIQPTSAGSWPNVGAVNIRADGVTFDGFEVDASLAAQNGINAYGASDVTISNNTVYGANHTWDGVGIFVWDWTSSYTVDNALIENNEVYETGRMGIFCMDYDTANSEYDLTEGHIIRGNTVHDTWQVGWGDHGGAIQINVGKDCTITDNTVYNTPGVSHYNASIYMFGSGSGNTITHNTLRDSASGITLWIDGAGGSPIDWEGDTATSPDVTSNNIYDNTYYGAYNSGSIVLDAELNWWGAADGPYHANGNHGSGDNVSDNVDYCPWLDAPAPGGSATYRVQNTDTGEWFCTIQGAIDDADTDAGDTIHASAGVYTETISIDKEITLLGPNAGINGTSGSRGAEATIRYPDGMEASSPGSWAVLIWIDANNVTIDGFEITDGGFASSVNYSDSTAITNNYTVPLGNNTVITNNIVDGNFSLISVWMSTWPNDGIGLTGVEITDNYVTGNHGLYHAIYLQEVAGTVSGNTVDDCAAAIQIQPYIDPVGGTVTNNHFSGYVNGLYYNYAMKGAAKWVIEENHITPCAVPSWESGPVSWSGIYVRTYATSGSGGACEAEFNNNTVDCAGASSTDPFYDNVIAVRLRNNNEMGKATFYGNTFTNFETGVYVRNDADVSNVSFHYNNFLGSSIAVNNTYPAVLDATYNFWGHSSGPYHPTENQYGQGGNVSDNVSFRPWLDDTWPDDDYDNEKDSGVEDSYYEDVPAGTETTTGGKDETGTTVTVNTSTPASVTTLEYEENPEGDAVGGYALDGTFVDVSMNDTSGVDWPINITIYYTAADLAASGLDEGDLQGVFAWNGTAGEWQLCNVTGVNTGYADGTYIGYVWAHVWHLSPHAAGGSDTEAPTTTKTVGEPKWGPTGGANYVTSSTEFNFTAVDNPSGGSGVNATYYRVWYNGAWTPAPGTGVGLNDNFMVYTGNFTLSGECIHYLEFYSDDNAGNMEAVTNQTHRVDDTPPQSGLQVGDPKWPQSQGATYITTSTELTLFAQDTYGSCNVGSWRIYYRVWNQTGGWTTWQVGGIGDVVHVTFDEECKHYIEYYAVDNLDNTETTIHNRSFYVDDTPPSSSIERGEPSCGNYALDFNGSHYVEVPHAASLDMGSSDWTIDVWIKTSSTNRGGIVRKNAIGSWQPVYDLEMQSNGRIRWLIDDSTNSASLTSTFAVNDGQWHHIVATRNGGTIELYIDGSLDTSAAAGTVGAVTTGDELYIGCMADGNPPPYYGFEGVIDDVKIYNAALSLTDVQNNYNHNVVTTNLVSRWDFNEGTGSTATDVADGNDGTIYGAMYTTDTPSTCIMTATPIYVNATDPGAPCAADNSSIWYRIWNGTWSGWQRTYYQDLMLTFDEECEHYLEYYAADSLGNDEGVIHNVTFYVDDSAPSIEKTVGDPNCTIIAGEEYCVQTATDITIDATNMGCCPGMVIEYRVDGGTWTDVTASLPYVYNFASEGTHTLDIRAYDCIGNIQYDNETFHVDDTAPAIDKDVGDPSCLVDTGSPYDEWCVTTTTPITINASDACDIVNVSYRITSGAWVDITGSLPYVHTFAAEGTFNLQIYAEDCLGNSVTDTEVFYVDEQPPVIEKTVGDPNVSIGGGDYYVTTGTPITINATNMGSCPNMTVAYQIWNTTSDTGWINLTTLPYTFTFGEECMHNLSIKAYDCVGNIVYENETFYVDDTPPTSQKYYGDPSYDGPSVTWSGPGVTTDKYVTSYTNFTINATDLGDCASGVGTIYYAVYRWDGSVWVTIQGDTAYTGPFSMASLGDTNECLHHIAYNSEDNLGNEESRNRNYFMVDNTPPNSTKEVGEPSVELTPDEYSITPYTPIWINATDNETSDCVVGSYHIHWAVWDDTGTMIDSGTTHNANKTLLIDDECTHTLGYWVEDNLCNRWPATGYHNETFHVDGSAPLVNKTIVNGGYHDGDGNYYVNQSATIYLNVTDLPDCSLDDWTLHYRVWYNGSYTIWDNVTSNDSFSFTEDCVHYLEYWVEDGFGNRWPTTGWHNETFYVDSVAPTSSLEIGDPKYPHDTSTATHVTTDTWLLLYGSDTGCPASGTWQMHYRIYYNGTWSSVHTEDVWQPFNITFAEECNHTIEYWATDLAGNEGIHHTRQLYVDDTPPAEDLNVGSPSFQSGSWFYVTLDTPIWLNATDMGLTPECAVGELTIHYRTQFNGTWTPWVTTGSNVSIDFTENCTHRLQYWIEDELGNRFPSSGYRTWGFYVGGGLPDATLQFGEPYYMDYITKDTPIYINATGDMTHTNYQIYYKVNNGSWFTGAWNNNVTFTFAGIGVMDNCTHTIYYNITNNMGEWEEYNYTVYVDNIKPTVDKDVGMPQYGENVTSDTPFWLNVSDAGSCSSGIAELHYRIYYNGSWHTYTTYGNTTFTFGDFVWNGECEHTIEAYAVDNLGHESTLIYQTHYVDDTPPTSQKIYGDPKYDGPTVSWSLGGVHGTQVIDRYVTSDTEFTITAADNGSCVSGVGTIYYAVYRWDGSGWVTIQGDTAYTGPFSMASLGDTNECLHHIAFNSEDNLGNEESRNRNYFMVDNTPPYSTKEVGEPKNVIVPDSEYCIETTTPIWINATDNGTTPCITDNYTIHWTIWNATGVYDSGMSTNMDVELYIDEECTHTLGYYVEDALGNRWPASGWHNETFHVDDYPPVLHKTVGDPNVTVTPGDEYYVTTGTPITIDAETGCCDMTVMYNNGSGWVDITGSLPYVHYFDSECDHWLNVTITDAMGRTVYDNETFHVDDTPPTTTLEYGTPYYTSGGNEWITTGTTVYLNATDGPACSSGYIEIHYNYGDGWNTVVGSSTSFTIPTECSHTIDWYAVDELGNTETTHSTDVNVDSTPPSTTIEYGGMHYTDGTDTWISTGTTIYLNATDGPACASGVATIYYTYNGTWQTAPGDVSFTIPDNCTHTLEWYAVDELGNTETTHTQTVNVDDAAPSTTLEYGTPYYTDGTEEWITPDTTIYLNATDYPGCASGVAEIWYNYGAGWNTVVGSQATFDIPDECTHTIEWYAVDNLGHEETHHFTDVNVDDTAPTATLELGTPYYTDGTTEWITSDTTIYINTTEYPACASGIAEIVYSYDGGTSWYSVAATQTTFQIPVECNHTLIWYAVDNLGNEGTHHTRDVKVDNTPPTIENTVGEPKVVVFPGDKYYITSSTVIDFTASDEGCSGGVGWKNITYRTWYNGTWSNWTTVTPLRYTITLSGEGVHYLEIIASDQLGNTGYDNVTFIVDDSPPDINKTVGVPSDPSCPYNDWVVETGTDIILSATDASPALTIQYSLDGGAWTSVANPYVFNFPATGIHTLDIRASDGLGHVSYDNETFWVASDMSDSTPPTSWHTPTWIEDSNPTPNTKITIKAEDDDNPWQIHYRVNGGAEKTGDINQYVNLHFTPGQITLEYWAVDLACNEETPHHVIEFRVAMGDITDLIFFDGPHELVDGKHEITTETKIGFDFDKAEGMGITEIWYRVNKGTQITGEYSRYYNPFTLDEGTYTIYYYGIHQTGQKTPTASTTVYVSGNEAPQTSITLNPSSPDGNDGWYRSAVTAMLSATDPDGDATTTYYRIDDGDWNEYTWPFTVREHDQHTISYYSVDTEGNEETPHSKTVKIDGDAPEITLHKPGGNLYIFNREIMPLPRGRTIIIGQISIEATVTDPATSGVDSATLYLDGTAKGMFQEDISYVLDETLFGEHTITIEAYDVAGNRAVKEITATILNIRIFGNAGP
jgi:hypothetical protein